MTIYGAPVCRVELRHKRKRWKFPDDPFVTYEVTDEDWCRYFGIGKEVEEEVTLTIPRAICTQVTANEMEFTAIATETEPLLPNTPFPQPS